MSNDGDWKFAADGSKTGWLKNKAALGKIKIRNIIRLLALIAVVLTSWNFFALFVSFMPIFQFWPTFLMQYAPESMTSMAAQIVAAVVGAIVVWFA